VRITTQVGSNASFMQATFVELASRIGFIQWVLNQLFPLMQLRSSGSVL